MSVLLVRVDSRLMHGQIVTAWVPSLAIDLVVVADDEVLTDDFERELMRSTAPPGLEVEICGIAAVGGRIAELDERRVLVLFRAVEAALAARSQGFRFDRLNLGNCHAGGARERVTDSVYLAPQDVQRLRALSCEGVEVFCQALPTEAPHPLRAGLVGPAEGA